MLCCNPMPMNYISMCSNTLYCLKWMQEAVWGGCQPQHDMMPSIQLHTSDPEPKNLSVLLWVKLCMAATGCQWTAYHCGQTLCIVLRMWEVVWGSCQPQPWRNDIILTPQVTQNPKSEPKPSRVGIIVILLPYAHWHHVNVVKHFAYVY